MVFISPNLVNFSRRIFLRFALSEIVSATISFAPLMASSTVMFEVNLKPLLMQPPLKGKVILGLDPAYRTGCKTLTLCLSIRSFNLSSASSILFCGGVG